MRVVIACVALFAWLLTNTTASAKPQTKIKNPEKRRLTQFVQKADLDQDPSQASAWASDGTFQIGAMPKQTGPEAIRRFLAGFFGAKLFVKLEHQMVEVIESKQRLVYKAVAVYTLKDGRKLNIPYVNWITYKRQGKVLKFATYQVFIDASPLMNAAKVF